MYIYIGERQGGECEGDLSLPVLTAAIDPNDFFLKPISAYGNIPVKYYFIYCDLIIKPTFIHVDSNSCVPQRI